MESRCTGRLLLLAPLGSLTASIGSALVVRGYTPLLAEHPSAALELLRHEGVDGIIVDAGWAAADPERVKALLRAVPGIRMVVVGSMPPRSSLPAAQWVGAPCLAIKPGFVDDLCRALRSRGTSIRARPATPTPAAPASPAGSGRLLVIARPGSRTASLADALRARGYAPVVLPTMEAGLSSLVHLVFDAVIVDVEHVAGRPEKIFAVERSATRVRVIFTGDLAREEDRERIVWSGALHVPADLLTAEELARLIPLTEAPRGRWRDTTRRVLAGIKNLFTRP